MPRMTHSFKLLRGFCLSMVLIPLCASADTPGNHPGYLHALSDLRAARYDLGRPHAGERDRHAIEEIDRAIEEIKHAAIDDGKNVNDHPPIDQTLDERGRFHQALDLLGRAHEEINKEEDNEYAQHLQQRALMHIDEAHHLVEEIVSHW